MTATSGFRPGSHGASASRSNFSRSMILSLQLRAHPLERTAQMALHSRKWNRQQRRDFRQIQVLLEAKQNDCPRMRCETKQKRAQSFAGQRVRIPLYHCRFQERRHCFDGYQRWPASVMAQSIDAPVGDRTQKPLPEMLVITDLVQCAMQLQKHILKKFLCVRSAARESIGDAEYTPLVGAHQMAKSLYIAASCPLQAGR